MTAIASTNVTVTITGRDRVGKELKVTGTIAFGNGSLTYPSGGVPLPAKAGYFRLNTINRMHLLGAADVGYLYKYDATNHKIIIFTDTSHTHNLLYKGGITATEPVAIDGGDTLGKNAATDRTIAGSTSAAKGGVVAQTAAGFDGMGTGVAPAAVTLAFEAWGN